MIAIVSYDPLRNFRSPSEASVKSLHISLIDQGLNPIQSVLTEVSSEKLVVARLLGKEDIFRNNFHEMFPTFPFLELFHKPSLFIEPGKFYFWV